MEIRARSKTNEDSWIVVRIVSSNSVTVGADGYLVRPQEGVVHRSLADEVKQVAAAIRAEGIEEGNLRVSEANRPSQSSEPPKKRRPGYRVHVAPAGDFLALTLEYWAECPRNRLSGRLCKLSPDVQPEIVVHQGESVRFPIGRGTGRFQIPLVTRGLLAFRRGFWATGRFDIVIEHGYHGRDGKWTFPVDLSESAFYKIHHDEYATWFDAVYFDADRNEENSGPNMFGSRYAVHYIDVQVEKYSAYIDRYGASGRFADEAKAQRTRLVEARWRLAHSQAAVDKERTEITAEVFAPAAEASQGTSQSGSQDRVWVCPLRCSLFADMMFESRCNGTSGRRLGTSSVKAPSSAIAAMRAKSEADRREPCAPCGYVEVGLCE